MITILFLAILAPLAPRSNAAVSLPTPLGVGAGGAAPAGLDCNGNGIEDSVDIAVGRSADMNQDGIPDECPSGTDGTQGEGTVARSVILRVGDLAGGGPRSGVGRWEAGRAQPLARGSDPPSPRSGHFALPWIQAVLRRVAAVPGAPRH